MTGHDRILYLNPIASALTLALTLTLTLVLVLCQRLWFCIEG